MKLCTYSSDGRHQVGVVVDGLVYGLSQVALTQQIEIPPLGEIDPLRDLMTHEQTWSALSSALMGSDSSTAGDEPLGSVESMSLQAPIVRPEKVICIGLNYRSHAEEAGMELTPVPTFFAKFPNAYRGHGDPIVIPRVSHRIDWEGEIGVVIGKRCSDVDAADALSYVGGFTVVNDVTARDYQFKTSQWMLGKTFDSFAPMGPVIATPDEVGDHENIQLETVVSGTTFQSGSSSDMVFSIPTLVEFLSSIMTLEPGDIIATGTPSGIGALQKPSRWLVDGDVVSVTVPGVGTLSNRVVSLPEGRP
jgi:acylpyruvate hydrolase